MADFLEDNFEDDPSLLGPQATDSPRPALPTTPLARPISSDYTPPAHESEPVLGERTLLAMRSTLAGLREIPEQDRLRIKVAAKLTQELEQGQGMEREQALRTAVEMSMNAIYSPYDKEIFLPEDQYEGVLSNIVAGAVDGFRLPAEIFDTKEEIGRRIIEERRTGRVPDGISDGILQATGEIGAMAGVGYATKVLAGLAVGNSWNPLGWAVGLTALVSGGAMLAMGVLSHLAESRRREVMAVLDAGVDDGEIESFMNQTLGTALGMTEFIPITRGFSRVARILKTADMPPAARQKLLNQIGGGMLKEGGGMALEESIQEGGSAVGHAWLNEKYVDPSAPMIETLWGDLANSMIVGGGAGGTFGAIMGGMAETAAGVRKRRRAQRIANPRAAERERVEFGDPPNEDDREERSKYRQFINEEDEDDGQGPPPPPDGAGPKRDGNEEYWDQFQGADGKWGLPDTDTQRKGGAATDEQMKWSWQQKEQPRFDTKEEFIDFITNPNRQEAHNLDLDFNEYDKYTGNEPLSPVIGDGGVFVNKDGDYIFSDGKHGIVWSPNGEIKIQFSLGSNGYWSDLSDGEAQKIIDEKIAERGGEIPELKSGMNISKRGELTIKDGNVKEGFGEGISIKWAGHGMVLDQIYGSSAKTGTARANKTGISHEGLRVFIAKMQAMDKASAAGESTESQTAPREFKRKKVGKTSSWQGREDRVGKVGRREINSIAGNLNPSRLGESTTAADGAPIIEGLDQIGMEKGAAFKGVKGKEAVVVGPSHTAKSVTGNYALVELDDVVASLRSDGEAEPNYLDGAHEDGSPAMRAANNGRIAALKRVWEMADPEKRDLYVQWLGENLKNFGFTKAKFSKFSKPVLVRVLSSEDAEWAATVSNVQTTASVSNVGQAIKDAAVLATANIDFDSLGNMQDLKSTGTKAALRAMRLLIGDDTHLAKEYLDDRGERMTQKGATRLRAALVALAYRNEEMVSMITEFTDDNRNFASAMARAAKLFASIPEGMGAYDPSPYILAGFNFMRNRGGKGKYAGKDMFDDQKSREQLEFESVAKGVAEVLFARKRSPLQMYKFLEDLFNAIKPVITPLGERQSGQGGLDLGDATQPDSMHDILRQVLAKHGVSVGLDDDQMTLERESEMLNRQGEDEDQAPMFSLKPPAEAVDSKGQYDPSTDPRLQGVHPDTLDEDGKPRSVWHGSAEAEKVRRSGFRLGKRGAHTDAESAKVSFWGVDNKKVATTYSFSESWSGGGDSKLVRMFVSLRNPLVVDAKGHSLFKEDGELRGIGDLRHGLTPLLETARKMGHDGLIVKNFLDYMVGVDAEGYWHMPLTDSDIREYAGTHYAVFNPARFINAETGEAMVDQNEVPKLIREEKKLVEKLEAIKAYLKQGIKVNRNDDNEMYLAEGVRYGNQTIGEDWLFYHETPALARKTMKNELEHEADQVRKSLSEIRAQIEKVPGELSAMLDEPLYSVNASEGGQVAAEVNEAVDEFSGKEVTAYVTRRVGDYVEVEVSLYGETDSVWFYVGEGPTDYEATPSEIGNQGFIEPREDAASYGETVRESVVSRLENKEQELEERLDEKRQDEQYSQYFDAQADIWNRLEKTMEALGFESNGRNYNGHVYFHHPDYPDREFKIRVKDHDWAVGSGGFFGHTEPDYQVVLKLGDAEAYFNNPDGWLAENREYLSNSLEDTVAFWKAEGDRETTTPQQSAIPPIADSDSTPETAASTREATAPTGRGAQKVIEAIMKRMRGAYRNLKRVSVVESVNDLPEEVRKDGTKGVYWKGRVWLVAENISIGEEFAVLAHELGVHHHLVQMLGKEGVRSIGKLIFAEARRGNAAAKAAVARIPPGMSRDNAHEEVVAYMVENNLASPITQRVFTMLRDFLRKTFGLEGFNETELVDMVVSSMRKGYHKGGLNSAPMHSMTGGANNTLFDILQTSTPGWVANKLDWLWRNRFAVLPMNGGISYLAGRIPHFGEYARAATHATQRSKALMQEAQKLWEDEVGLIDDDRDRLSRVKMAATMLNMLPEGEEQEAIRGLNDTATQEYARMVNEWNRLSPKAKEVFNEQHAFLGNVNDRMRMAMVAQLRNALGAGKIDQATFERMHNALLGGENIKATGAVGSRLRQQVNETNARKVYFPLMRFGEYWVSYKHPDSKDIKTNKPVSAFSMFENTKQRDEFIAKIEMTGGKVISTGRNVKADKRVDSPEGTFLADAQRVVESLSGESDANEEFKKMVSDSLMGLYLQNRAAVSGAGFMMQRKGIHGASMDAPRSFAKYAEQVAPRVGMMEVGYVMNEALMDLQAEIRVATNKKRVREAVMEFGEDDEGVAFLLELHNDPKLASLANDVLGEMKASLSHHLRSKGPWEKMIGNYQGFTFLWMLGANPSSALINLTQMLLTSTHMVGRYGWGAMPEIGKAMVDVLSLGDGTGGDSTEHALMREAEERGAVAPIAVAAMSGEDSTGQQVSAQQSLYKLKKVMAAMFSGVEVYNRRATFLATYRIEREAGLDHDGAFDRAYDATISTQFDPSGSNLPRIVRNPAIRPFAQFTFVIYQYHVYMAQRLHRMLSSDDSVTPEMKRVARNQLAYTAIMTWGMAGIKGMPFGWLVMSFLELLTELFDGDDPRPASMVLDEVLRDAMGDTGADMLTRGVMDRSGINLSGRLAMTKGRVDTTVPPKDGRSAVREFGKNVLGVPLSMYDTFERGSGAIADGDVAEGVRTMMPVGAANLWKAVELAASGGERRDDSGAVVDRYTAWGVFMRGVGFATTESRRKREAHNYFLTIERMGQAGRQEIYERYWEVLLADQEGRLMPEERDRQTAEVADMIRGHNMKWVPLDPWQAITRSRLRGSLSGRIRAHRRGGGLGIRLTSPQLREQYIQRLEEIGAITEGEYE